MLVNEKGELINKNLVRGDFKPPKSWLKECTVVKSKPTPKPPRGQKPGA